MTFSYPVIGVNDFYTAYLEAAIAAGGVPTGYGGPYSGATAYQIDPTLNNGLNIFKLNTSAAAAITFSFPGSWSVPGLLNDSCRIRIVVNQGAWSNTFAFPTNMVLQRNVGVPATPPIAGVFEIEFAYDSVLNIWMERGRRFTPNATSTPVAGGWTNITLAVGTANGAWSTPQYKLYPDGIVRWRGLIFLPGSSTSASTTIFTLPSAYIPGVASPTQTEEITVGLLPSAGAYTSTGLSVNTSTGTVQNLQALAASGALILTGVTYDTLAA